MADSSSHVNVPTGARRKATSTYSEPLAGKTSGNSPHVNVPAPPANRDGSTDPFVKVASGECAEGSFENPTEWGDGGGWSQS